MDLNTITVEQFQENFFRDFPYLPTYSSLVTYNAGAISFYSGSFWTAQENGVLNVTPGTNTAKWLPTAMCLNEYVLPQDINKAFKEAQVTFNQRLFTDDATITLAYLYATAHYLVIDLRNAMQGVNSAGGGFPVSSRSVGSMSESYSVPDSYKDNPQIALFASTGYGQKYLSMVLPRLVGNIVSVYGGTNA